MLAQERGADGDRMGLGKARAVLCAAAVLAVTSCTSPSADYPLHRDITATVFWVGEPASTDNDEIANAKSYWDGAWEQHFGGFDDPEHRTADGSRPAAFRPEENPFYFALPYGELDERDAVKADLPAVPWYGGETVSRSHSILKNRWIEVRLGSRTAYAQWQDVGPFGEDDADYVFGDARPRERRAGLDLSPATAAALGLNGRGQVSWRFVRAADVPDGPWTQVTTTRGGIPENDK
jgi:hypothetical protein